VDEERQDQSCYCHTQERKLITSIIEMERSSIARIQAKSVSVQILDVLATGAPRDRKNVIADKTWTMTSQRTA
jgi:hypothetical protein